MTKHLPPNLLALFFPRDPLPYKPPIKNRKTPNKPYSGISQYLSYFEEIFNGEAPPPFEAAHERRERKRLERIEKHNKLLKEKIEKWAPKNNINIQGNPYKTLFNFETSEDRLKSELERYGPIKKVVIIKNIKTQKSRGYGFIEFEHEKDMRTAYKRANGLKIDGRRILVDVERGRTDKHWLPMYLGGGLGGESRKQKRHNSFDYYDDKYRTRSRSRERDRDRDRDRSRKRNADDDYNRDEYKSSRSKRSNYD